MSRRTRARAGDDGATAVITAVIAVLLFGMAALAVEITDMYSRDRATQTTADLAALSGAQGLPGVCQAFDRAMETLNAEANGVSDADDPTQFSASATELQDGNPENGEVWVLSSFDETAGTFPAAAVLDRSACNGTQTSTTSDTLVGAARFVRVLTPTRTIDFALAAALPGAPEEGAVQSVATVGLRSPNIGQTMPVFIPGGDGCGFGANYVVTDSGSPTSGPSGEPRYLPDGVPTEPQAPYVISVTSEVVEGGLRQQVRIEVQNLLLPPTLTSVGFDFQTGRGANYKRFPAGTGAHDPSALVSFSGTGPYSAVYTVPLPNAEVTSVGGWWFVRASETPPVTDPPTIRRWTHDARTGAFSVSAAASAGCGDRATGDFGLLRSDRSDSPSDTLIRNFILGLQPSITSIPLLPAIDTPCTADESPPTAVVPSDRPGVLKEGANCLDIEPGGTRGQISNGLIEGEPSAGGLHGRLDVRRGEPGTSFPGCASEPTGSGNPGPFTDYRWNTRTGFTIWNTTLSCYVAGGSDLSDVLTCDGCLDPSIINDPRYFVIPVLHTSGRPATSGEWPIREFRGAFITNEAVAVDDTVQPARCISSDNCNGLEFNTSGARQLFAVQTFVFPLDALPDDLPTTGNGGSYTGIGPKDFLLVE